MAAVHSCEPGVHIIFGIEGCSANYTNFFSFKKHVYRKHRPCVDTTLSVPIPHNGISVSSPIADQCVELDMYTSRK